MTSGGVAADPVDKIVVAKPVLGQAALQRPEAHAQRRSNGRKRRLPLLHDRLDDQRDLVDQAADDEPAQHCFRLPFQRLRQRRIGTDQAPREVGTAKRDAVMSAELDRAAEHVFVARGMGRPRPAEAAASGAIGWRVKRAANAASETTPMSSLA